MTMQNFFSLFSANHLRDPQSPNHVHENLLHRTNARKCGFRVSVSRLLGLFFSGNDKNDDGLRREDGEEKVRSWLYTLAQSEKDLVFEYVQSTERGLSFTEAERRLRQNGPNIPLHYTFPSWWHLLWNASFHPFNIILIVLSILSYLANDSLNGYIMLVLVIISVSLRFYQEYSSSKAAMKLSEFVTYPVKVKRCAGRIFQTELLVQVDQRDVVPGDIIIFEPGDLFPGDTRLLTSKHLVVSQSSLTGEFGISEKTADVREDQNTPLLDLKNICFLGTNVISGSGTGLVVSVGSQTYMSTTFLNMGKQRPADDFEKGIRLISYVLVGVMLVLATVILLVDYYMSRDLSESLLFAISIASALTPQMLPLIVNASLARGALAMARDRCIVKGLTAMRDMGSMDILCIDKTGTLTMNHAIVVNHLNTWGSVEEKVLCFGFLNAYFMNEQKYPLDDAILAHVYTNGYRFQPSKWIKIDEVPFDFTRRRVSVILDTQLIDKDKTCDFAKRIVITKGALEEVIKTCSLIDHFDRGGVATFSSEDHHRILNIAEELSNYGLRVIGVAMNKVEMQPGNRDVAYDETVEHDMVFLGIISFFDPPKDSAKQALHRLSEKGVKAKVLTGDSLSLAIRICKEVGISTSCITTGPDLDLLDQESFHETIKKSTVLARLTPSQKLRVVQSLQNVGGHIVGFLGDGVNDSLALDAANIGISVDSGASIAKEFADIILLEKDLNVLVAGVERGRLTFANTMKYIKMSVIANIGSTVSLLIATVVFGFEPLIPRQILIQNFLYNVGEIAITWDRVEEDYVKSPQRWSLKGLATFILWNGPVCTLCDVSALMFICFYYPSDNDEFVRCAWFIEGLLMHTLIIHLIRTEKTPFIQEIASWPVICSTVIVSAVGISIVYSPIVTDIGFTRMPLSYFGFLVLLFVGYFTVGQIVKRFYIRVYKTWL